MCADHELYLIAFVESKSELQYKKDLDPIFKEVHLIYQPKWKSYLYSALNVLDTMPFQLAYFKSNLMSKQIHSFLDTTKIDVIHTQHLRMSQYTRALKKYPRILDLPDAYSLYWKRRKEVDRPWWNRLFDTLESKRVIEAEKVVFDYDLNLVCSVEDRDHLLKIHPGSKVKLLRNGVDLETFSFNNHDYSRAKTLLFTGNMDYAPNVDAVVYFVENMWTQLTKSHPEIKLVIAGQRPVKQVLDLASKNIQITGFVQDISDMYRQADIVIAPLRFGAGTQNKVLEALAMGVPVVCTDIGFKGLEIESGDGVFHAANDNQFIDHVSALLASKELRESTGQRGLKLAQTKFSWDGLAKTLEEHFFSLLVK
ncbi:MAG: glycosyltransferase involved in cell wall biosynthesis [Bacteroidia bacterium]